MYIELDMNYATSDLITWMFLGFIIGAFILFVIQSSKMMTIRKSILNSLNSDDILSSLEKSAVKPLMDKYRPTITECDNKKSNIPSSELFTMQQIAKCGKFNLHLLDAASGTLVGLGLLGTFAGLTYGIQGFNSDTTDTIQSSINGLLGGMGTAFLTSLFGMSASLIFTIIDKIYRNNLQRAVYDLTEAIDNKYYIDDMGLMKLYQQKKIDDVVNHLVYVNNEGQSVSISNAIREILTENAEQSKALKSFSTDLAIELNNGFDEALSRQMQNRILPLMESVDGTTKALIEHIDQMAETVASPATDMMQAVVDDLKRSMQSVMNEISNGLSTSATAELESLAVQLGTATQAMADFPKNMQVISSTLQVTDRKSVV